MYPAFVDDDVYLGMNSSVSEKDQMKAMLSNLTRIHLLTSHSFDTFDELIREYIVSGVEVFGMETGIVSEVSSAGVYKILDVVSPIEVLEKGMEFNLDDTYCREVIKSQQVIGFPMVGKLSYMKCHPVYQNLKLEAYLSAPIYVEDTLIGTFNFTSITPRENGFSKYEHNLIRLMAHSIGSYILLRSKEDKLKDLNDKLKRFVGYVAHDLRNPLGTIIGYSKMISKEGTSIERIKSISQNIRRPAESALELVNTILDSAALGTGKLSLELKVNTVDSILKKALDAVNLFCESKSIQIVINPSCSGSVVSDLDRLSQSLVNLLINAIKYSPAGGSILIAIEPQPSSYKFVISNHVVERSDQTLELDQELYGSVGFGLEIVDEVLSLHNSEKTISIKNNVFEVSFEIASS